MKGPSLHEHAQLQLQVLLDIYRNIPSTNRGSPQPELGSHVNVGFFVLVGEYMLLFYDTAKVVIDTACCVCCVLCKRRVCGRVLCVQFEMDQPRFWMWVWTSTPIALQNVCVNTVS